MYPILIKWYSKSKQTLEKIVIVLPKKDRSETMHYIRITKENIDKEHICCAMSGKNSIVKKEWLKQRFEEGLVFYRSAERGKCFIEYIPAENAWVPIDADGYIYINCLWVSGSMKGHGYSNDLLNECNRDAKEQEKKGVQIEVYERGNIINNPILLYDNKHFNSNFNSFEEALKFGRKHSFEQCKNNIANRIAEIERRLNKMNTNESSILRQLEQFKTELKLKESEMER